MGSLIGAMKTLLTLDGSSPYRLKKRPSMFCQELECSICMPLGCVPSVICAAHLCWSTLWYTMVRSWHCHRMISDTGASNQERGYVVCVQSVRVQVTHFQMATTEMTSIAKELPPLSEDASPSFVKVHRPPTSPRRDGTGAANSRLHVNTDPLPWRKGMAMSGLLSFFQSNNHLLPTSKGLKWEHNIDMSCVLVSLNNHLPPPAMYSVKTINFVQNTPHHSNRLPYPQWRTWTA